MPVLVFAPVDVHWVHFGACHAYRPIVESILNNGILAKVLEVGAEGAVEVQDVSLSGPCRSGGSEQLFVLPVFDNQATKEPEQPRGESFRPRLFVVDTICKKARADMLSTHSCVFALSSICTHLHQE